MGNWINHHTLAMCPQSDKGGACADWISKRRAAPHDRTAPMDWWLVRMHLCPHRRMQSIGANHQLTRLTNRRAVSKVDQRTHRAVGVFFISCNLMSEPDHVSAGAFAHLIVQ